MPVKVLPGQPLKLNPYNEPRFCQSGDSYCYLHQDNDPVRLQFRQISFGVNHSCDPFFSSTGSEIVTNGDFNGSAAGWTLVNSTYGSNKVCFDGTPTASFGQTPLGTSTSTIYKIIVVVDSLTTGTFDVVFGNNTVAVISASGTYAINAFPGAFDNIGFATSDSCDACISLVSIKQLFPCWAYDNGDFLATFNSTTFGNNITHIPGTQTTFTTTGTLIEGDYYQAKIRVQGRTQGYVQMFAGDLDVLSTPITQNGTFTQYLYAHGTGVPIGDPVDFLFVMSDDFDGTIEFLFVFGLRTDFICTLLEQDGTPVADLSSHLIYNDDYVTLSFSGLQGITDFNSNPIGYGCYKIGLTDRDGINYVVNGEFDTNTDWFGSCYFGTWFDSGQATGVSDGNPCTPIELVQPNSLGLVTGVYYIAQFRYKSNFVDGGNDISFDVCGTTVGNVSPTTSFQTFVSGPFQITNPANQIRFHFEYGDITLGNSMTIDSVQVYSFGQYVTNCINYKAEHEGTYGVLARGNFIPRSFGFGFLFRPLNLYVFHLFQRLKLGFRKPRYPDQFEGGAYSTGRHYKSFGLSQKVFEVVFEPIGEVEHDCMAVMIQCPQFFISGVSGGLEQYHVITDEYTPNYDDRGELIRTDSVIEVQYIQDIVKISNL